MSAVFESPAAANAATSKIAPQKRSLDEINQITRTPFPGSSKAYLPGSRPDILVPVRDIVLTNGKTASVYDTSGPYTDPAAAINVRQGLPALRAQWIAERGDTEIYTGRSAALLDDGGKNEDTEAARIAHQRQYCRHRLWHPIGHRYQFARQHRVNRAMHPHYPLLHWPIA